jgi:hypothetical protein
VWNLKGDNSCKAYYFRLKVENVQMVLLIKKMFLLEDSNVKATGDIYSQISFFWPQISGIISSSLLNFPRIKNNSSDCTMYVYVQKNV